MAYKQVILVRQDLKLPKGKLAAQVAHASVEAAMASGKAAISHWRRGGQKKIVLKVASLEELETFQRLFREAGMVTALITDAGHTVVEPGTVTCLGVGPDEEKRIDTISGRLKMV